uniref:Uncharacterized protein n=1 Tax=Pararge aegeria TaxID=116150 RepID=S4PVL0_9NEOP
MSHQVMSHQYQHLLMITVYHQGHLMISIMIKHELLILNTQNHKRSMVKIIGNYSGRRILESSMLYITLTT